VKKGSAMAKRKKLNAINIYDIKKYLNKEKPLPIYYFFGKDNFAKDAVVKMVLDNYSGLVLSDFDRETIECSKNTTIDQIVSLASAFPFGGEKKIVVVKNFEQIKNKKTFLSYVQSPSDFTILVILDNSETLYETELSRELNNNRYIFQAAGLSGRNWNDWIISRARELKLKISGINSQLLLELVGEDKSLLLRQLEKFADYLGEDKEITKELITELASKTKGYTIFDLQEAVMAGDKAEALKIGKNILNSGVDIGMIVNSLANFIYLTALSYELKRTENNANKEAGKLHQHPYYYGKARNAKYFSTNGIMKLERVFSALLNADLSIKTSAADSETVFVSLISGMFIED
jgi:DNA polymerase-3 subunit delta